MSGAGPVILSSTKQSAEAEQHYVEHVTPFHRSDNMKAALICTAIVVVLVAGLAWAQRWALSACAIESLVLIFGESTSSRLFSSIPLWSILAALNVVYAVCSTSWLLYGVFTALCYPLVLLTCLFQFDTAANFARKNLRKVLRQLHFTRDTIALFNIPALQIDTDVEGLFVVRGLSISLSNLTIEAHSIELGIKLSSDMELALYVDTVKVSLFRKIEIGDVFGNLKGGKVEMTFGDLDTEENEEDSDDSSIFNNTALLRAATVGSEGFKKRPQLRESLTGAHTIKDSSASAGLHSVKTLSPDDSKAEKQYLNILTEIRTTSAVYQSRQQVRKKAQGNNGFNIDNERDMRAAICSELHSLPTIVHAPERSVRVTTLQKLQHPSVRKFMHRMPFLLRLLLTPLTYFHPVTISSINAAGSGRFLSIILQQHVFKHYASDNAEIRRLARRINAWLTAANFAAELTDISALSQVPLSTSFDIVTYLNFKDIMAYRTVAETSTLTRVVQLAGADATFTIPSMLLPHHEHLIPPPPSPAEIEQLDVEVEESDGVPKTVQAEAKREKVLKDEATINMSVHGSLPAAADQSLLNFIAALVKATKIIELEKDLDDDVPETNGEPKGKDDEGKVKSSSASFFEADSNPPSPTKLKLSKTFPLATPDSPATPTKTDNLKSFARHVRQNLSVSSTNAGAAIKEFAQTNARDIQSTFKDLPDLMKKAAVGVAINDRWIARIVGKIAAKLESAQGDIGYSGGIPVALGPYRTAFEDGWQTKILP
ncbi:Hypothetical protein R9X50_00080400 [Acrodontium crateriforme]|uniref:Uncharacterized protein n=1 Tax=Acrodontium crateriforme TaxID=150365 RepID=A0AAQ3R7B9_9PEZI|nr:Hypothetical protein R9X50_00080400 [Acrodontium crateriforme]